MQQAPREVTGLFLKLFTAALLVAPAFSQIVPGQLPSGTPPPKPGQIDTNPQPKPNSTPDQNSPNTPASQPAEDIDKPIGSVTVHYVLVPTSVLDPDGHGYVNGLQAADFEVLDNDRPQKVIAEVTEQPLSVVLVVQANNEVEALLPKIKRSGLLLHGLVTGDNGDLAVLAFDHRMLHLQDFTTDPDRIDDAMQKIRAGSSTAALVDAVVEADHMLKRHDPQNKRRRVVILLSRNLDKGSEAHLQETVRAMQFDNVIVYAINMSKMLTTLMKKPDYPRPPDGGVPPEAMPPTIGGTGPRSQTSDIQQGEGTNGFAVVPPLFHGIRDLFKKTPAEAFSYFTGGREYSFATERALEDAVTDIGKDLNSQYLLSYRPNNSSEPGFHTIRVLVNRPGLAIRTRTGYWWGGGQF